MKKTLHRPAWVEVSLAALRGNIAHLRALSRPAELLPVVKANAYGHGLFNVARVLTGEGVKAAAVALPHEGAALRNAGFKGAILLIEPTLAEELNVVLKHRLTPQLSSLSEAIRLDREVRRSGKSPFPVQVEVDTGMGRVGFRPDEFLRDYPRLARLKGLRVEAVYTHLATADWADGTYALKQILHFHQLREKLYRTETATPWHLANSAALIGGIHGSRGDWMRPGLALYGVAPNARLEPKAALAPVMQFKTRVLLVKSIAAGDSVSYNRTFVAKKPTRIAVLAAGYADGVLRSLSNKGVCLLHARRAPFVGNVCMDMCMVDVTRIAGVKPGDTAVLWGRDGRAVLTVEEQAQAAGTIPYELLCAVSERVERIYT